MKAILSDNQQRLIFFLGKEKYICDTLYLGSGTALAEFYLHHRLSEDLDFFSEHEFDPATLSVFFKRIKKEAGILKIEYTQSFNRNFFFLELENDKIKTEFTYFPFPRIDETRRLDRLSVDSLLDIAVNKIFIIYQKPRSRDFIDLYCILQKEKSWNLNDLIEKAQIKFDTFLDPIQLGTRYMEVKELKDYPKMLIEIDEKDWQDFFMNEAKKLESKILK